MLYVFFIAMLLWQWNSIEKDQGTSQKEPFVSIVIPVRNEEATIKALLERLNEQSYPFEKMEVIVADDESTDKTRQVIEEVAHNLSFTLTLFTVAPHAYPSRKKEALRQAIEKSKGEVIITTDGDCLPTKEWIAGIVAPFDDEEVQLVTGPVAYWGKPKLFNALQRTELLSLIGVGGATIKMGFPTMCNGANLA